MAHKGWRIFEHSHWYKDNNKLTAVSEVCLSCNTRCHCKDKNKLVQLLQFLLPLPVRLLLSLKAYPITQRPTMFKRSDTDVWFHVNVRPVPPVWLLILNFCVYLYLIHSEGTNQTVHYCQQCDK